MDRSLNKIAVLGNWSEKNYGSEITYYALYSVIKSMGHEITLFERPREAAWGPNESPVLFQNNPYDSKDLMIFDTKIEMRDLNNKFNIFLIGSDQMWHHDLKDCFGNVCYFDFIDDTKKKVAYATSFGTNEWKGTDEEIESVSLCLKAFDDISVRETSGKKICKECFDVEAECVLDPVFLCDLSLFSELAGKSKMNVPEKYIGVYILDINNDKDMLLKHAENYLGIKANIISDAFKNNLENEWREQKRDIHLGVYIEDWLKNIISSDYVITDSFHGMCFAIMFKKQFVVYANQGRGVSRFIDLLEDLDLQERLVDQYQIDEVQKLLESKIDYQKVYSILEVKKEKSYSWLASALANVKLRKGDKYDFIKKKIYDCEYESYLRWKEQKSKLDACECSVKNNGEVVSRHEEVVNRHEEVVNRHEEVVNRHEEVVSRHEEVVNRHEEVINRHEEAINYQWGEQKELYKRLNELDEKYWCLKESYENSKKTLFNRIKAFIKEVH